MNEQTPSVESDVEASRSAPPAIVAENRRRDAPTSALDEPVTPMTEDEATSADAAGDGFLDELVLPSLVSAPEPLTAGAEIGADGRLRVIEHVGTRGRVNRYA